MRITPAEAGDLHEVLALERQTAEAPHWTEAAYRSIVESAEVSVRRCLLVGRNDCENDRELVGFAVGKLVGLEAELESVVVRVSARRAGVGKALCRAVLAWSWEQGGVGVELEVRASSAGAIALYTSLGFEVRGKRRRYYTAPVDDAVLMQLGRMSRSDADL